MEAIYGYIAQWVVAHPRAAVALAILGAAAIEALTGVTVSVSDEVTP